MLNFDHYNTIMKQYILLVTAFATLSLSAKKIPSGNVQQFNSFTENKGQVHDQNFEARNDVRFSGTDGNLNFYLKNDGISYQLSRVESWTEERDVRGRKTTMVPDQLTIYRIDVAWMNANTDCNVSAEGKMPGYSNYYVPSCPNGALEVMSYSEVTYENLYNGIDLKWYFKNGHLEYDYIVSPGADYHQILLSITGASSLKIDRQGVLIINTPLGTLTQQAPIASQNGRLLKSAWILTQDGSAGFSIEGYDPALPLVIDPIVRSWGTYYGGNGDDYGGTVIIDANGNLYVSGVAGSSFNMVTSGAHQVNYGGNTADAFLAKFNSSGVRIWSTLYGGGGLDFGSNCATDGSGNVYLSGTTTSSSPSSVIATFSGHQGGYGGNYDSFLVKFNASGVRQWGTFYGGSGSETGAGCATDAAGNVYLAGNTSSTANISTPGSHQPAYGTTNQDAYLVKFNTSGVRQWGTYYGSTNMETCYGVCSDGTNVFITGYTSGASTVITTAGAHQTTFGGSLYDVYLVKFDGSGVRQWGTYYGGNSDEIGMGCTADASGNVYITGETYSGNGIASPGAHQTGNASLGNRDSFLAKFNAAGVRQWGTFYGGTGYDNAAGCFVDAMGNVYLAGTTSSSGGVAIATAGAYQPVYGGGAEDAFLAKFNAAGVRQWGTYYGSTGSDGSGSVCTDASGNIYITGYTSTSGGSAISSAGSHQSTYGGGAYDGFITQFIDCALPSPVNTTPTGNRSVCSGMSASLSASGNGTITWYSSSTSTTVLGTGTAFITPTLTASNYTYFVEAQNCVPGTQRTPVSVTVNPLPIISISSSVTKHCLGSTSTLTANGASSYTWNNGGGGSSTFTVAPTVNTIYTVTGTNGVTGCSNTAVKTVSVVPAPQLTVSSSPTLICAGESTTLTASGANTYSWGTSGAGGSITVTLTASEAFTVTGTDNNGCTDTKVLNQQVNPCTELRERFANGQSIQVYPNPFKDRISIKTESGAQKEIEIVNMLGEVVFKGYTGADLKLGHLNCGLYLVRINGKVISKVVKE
jgi:hypothetical protein